MVCDMHGHFLPGMDDGCKDVQETVELLRYSYRNGINMMLATPHYYPVETVEEFLQRRKASFDALQTYLQENHITDVPQIRLGAEVAYRPGLSNMQDLEKLCLGNSRYMLLELPFETWSNSLLRDVRNIYCARGIVPIFAHIERYILLQKKEVFNQLLQLDGLMQINAGAFLKFPRNILCRKLVRRNMVHLLGSDCHNMQTRKQNLHLAADYFTKHRLMSNFEEMAALSCRIFNNC